METEEINKEQVEKILATYYEVVKNTQRALVFAGVPERLLFFYIFMPPALGSMMLEDTLNFYRDLQKAIIIHMRDMGLSQREIARRLRGGSYALVVEALKNITSSEEEEDGHTNNGENNPSE